MAPSERKIVVVGDGACGKTCLLVVFSRDEYLRHEFSRDYVPTIFDTYAKQLTVNERSIKLSLWDTAGQSEYDRIRPLAYPDTDVFLLCFALDCPDSFTRVQEKWIPEIRHFCPKVPVVLVGTKKDIRCRSRTHTDTDSELESISTENAKYLANKCAVFDYIECSARTNAGVREVFETAVRAAQDSAKKRKQERRSRPKCTIL